jgi:hypothetical protein
MSEVGQRRINWQQSWGSRATAESGFRTHFCILSETCQESCGFAFEGSGTVEKRDPAGRARDLRLVAGEFSRVAGAEDARANPTVY